MKDMLAQYALFNYWSNQRLIDTIAGLTEEQAQQKLVSSFPSIYETVLHMWNAEYAWYERVKMHERLILPSETFKGPMSELGTQMVLQSRLWSDWVNNSNDAALDHVVQYYNSKKESFKQPAWQIIIHVCNHGTYHRGQLVTMLRQVGCTKIPSTDFIQFTRTKKA